MGRIARGGADIGDQIEFLTPRDSLFGGDSPAEFTGFDIDDLPPPDDDEPRSRWVTVAAGLSVLALVAVGVVAAAPWQDDTTTAPPPTTMPPPETAPVTTVPAPLEANRPALTTPTTGYVFDPLPPGFMIGNAWSDNGDFVPDTTGWGEVWATPEATIGSGSWFSVTLTDDGPPFAVDATRIDLRGGIGLLSQAADGMLRLSAQVGMPESHRQLAVVAFGLGRDQLITLFDSISVDDRADIATGRPHFLDPGLLDGYEQVASKASQEDLIAAYLGSSPGAAAGHTSTYYANGTGDQVISIDTSPRDDALEPLGRLAMGAVRLFPDSTSVPSSFTGEGLVLGVSPSGSDPMVVARWHDRYTTVVVHTTIPLSDLLAMLPDLRQTSMREWQVTQRRAAANQTIDSGVSLNAPGTPIGGGTLTDGSTWSASWHTPNWIEVTTSDGSSIQQASADRDGPISVWTSTSAVTITVVAPPGPVPAVVRVLIRHQVLIEVPLVDIATLDPSASVAGRVAVVLTQHVGPFEIEVIDADETVIDHFLSPGYPT